MMIITDFRGVEILLTVSYAQVAANGIHYGRTYYMPGDEYNPYADFSGDAVKTWEAAVQRGYSERYGVNFPQRQETTDEKAKQDGNLHPVTESGGA